MSEAPVDPKVEVTLARPAYRLGSSVVGMIRVTTQPTSTSIGHPRYAVKSLQLIMAGHCRLDERWHNFIPSSARDGHLWEDFPLTENTLCVWSSNRVDLLHLQERAAGRWEDVRPKPIRLPGRPIISPVNNSDHHPDTPAHQPPLEHSQLVFSFRVDLPSASSCIAPSLVATSCRYYYTVVVRLVSSSTPEPQWIQIPVRILTADDDSSSHQRYHNTGGDSLQAMAHSSGLPTVLTARDLNQWEGRLSSVHHGAVSHGRHVIRRTDSVQTMRVTDPETGKPACLLTMIGASMLHPGSRMILKLDFPARHGASGSTSDWVAVHQVSACLQGEETAIRLRDGKRTRAHSFLFDTAHERIDPATVESMSMSLLLPPTALCTVQTERVEIHICCLVDICVGQLQKGSINYRNLRMEIPCQVVHSSPWETNPEDGDRCNKLVDALDAREQARYTDPTDPRSFTALDIRDELTILALCLADKCHIRPRTPYQEMMQVKHSGD
jgi:hypothetical protein